MKTVRYEADGTVSFGILEGETIRQISGPPWGDHRSTGDTVRVPDVRLLAPVAPAAIWALGRNYVSHLGDTASPEQPIIFQKPVSSIIGPDEAIVLPPDAGRVDEEGELVAVIGSRCRHVAESDALDHVFGYTVGQDVSARDWQRDDSSYWRAKGADTFSPLGPHIDTDVTPGGLEIRVTVNGEEAQRCNTSEMLFGVAFTIAYLSRYVTLEPGDLLFTGTSGVTRQLQAGDVVETAIAGIGALRNPVR